MSLRYPKRRPLMIGQGFHTPGCDWLKAAWWPRLLHNLFRYAAGETVSTWWIWCVFQPDSKLVSFNYSSPSILFLCTFKTYTIKLEMPQCFLQKNVMCPFCLNFQRTSTVFVNITTFEAQQIRQHTPYMNSLRLSRMSFSSSTYLSNNLSNNKEKNKYILQSIS